MANDVLALFKTYRLPQIIIQKRCVHKSVAKAVQIISWLSQY